MGAINVNGANAPPIESAEEMAGRFSSELMTRLPEWKQRLSADPSGLEALEQDVHAAFARGADLLLAGILAVVMKLPEFQDACEQTRRDYQYPLARGRNRTIQVRLLGGLLIWVTSLYCAPRKRLFPEPAEGVPGIYTELAQFGFGKGVTPGLQTRVAHEAALCPSFQFARGKLQRGGVNLDVKTIRRITNQCGAGLLALRKHELMLWREGKLPAGTELRGKRVTVQIDGGRTKIRGPLVDAPPRTEALDEEGLVMNDAPGRSKKRARKTYSADWREPKLLTIFVHDKEGKMEADGKATIDGTFLGPDATAELVAMHLHRLGAAEALSVTFVADGAPWIWDRVPTIVSRAKLEKVAVHQVLDCCHAAHHISLALAAMGYSDQERAAFYREQRSLLRNGRWRKVVDELSQLAEAVAPESTKAQTEIAYLRKHGEAGRMSYTHFRGLGIPLGSGAIESSIRRVINLRLKSNSLFWREGAAEEMLQVRAQVISDRWDARVAGMRQLLRHNGSLAWQWEPEPMSAKTEPATSKTN